MHILDITQILQKYSVPEKHLNMKFTDDLLILLTLQIQNMEEIAPHFDMSEDDIRQIKKDESSSENGRVVLMLSKWRQRQREGATYLSLVTIFSENCRWDIVDSIISNIQNKSPPVTVAFDPITFQNWNNCSDSERDIVRNNLREKVKKVQCIFAKTFADICDSFVKHQVDHIKIIAYLKQRCLFKDSSFYRAQTRKIREY